VPTGETGTVGPDLAGTYHAFTDAVAITDPDEAVHFTVHPIFDAWRLDPGTALTGLGWPVDDIRTDEDGIKGQAFTGGSLALQTDGTVTSVAAPAEPEPAPPLLRYLLAADPDRQLGAATPDNEVDFFLDGATAFVDMARTMRTATGPHDFIYLLGWYCDIDLELVPGQPWSALRSLLSAATHDDGDGRGAEVRCMLWQAKEKPPTPGAAVWEVARAVSLLKAFGGPPLNFTNYRAVQAINALPNGLAVLDNRTLLAGSHHQKLLIVRAGDRLVAYCGGMDLNPDRLHPQGVKGSRATGAPLQDVHLRIEGPGAFELLRTFRERWHATPEARGPLRGDALAPVSGMVAGPHLVQISHTYGRGCPFPTAIQTGREVLDNALRSARRYVYMECQYYVGNDHLRSALRDALRTIEVAIVVIAPLDAVDDLPDLAFRRKAFLAPLKTEFGDRLLVFEHLGDNRGTTTPGAYLHSKLILVDDEAAFIGTLNYSRRSWTHDSEVMVSIVDSRGPEGLGPLPGFAPALRQALWARRLGPLTPHDLTAALARFRSLPADARLVPYRHTTAVTRPKIAGVPVTPQVLDQYWHLLADPQG
jgi:phosphatidylserine/phosphatidylglycerophosphate/cardiolipin synthase-like enzyme